MPVVRPSLNIVMLSGFTADFAGQSEISLTLTAQFGVSVALTLTFSFLNFIYNYKSLGGVLGFWGFGVLGF